MHGRLKIKTTAEQQAAKKLEQEKKLKLYKEGTRKLFEKRENNEHDDEALSLTGEFLQQNPEFYSLWNFRREVLISLKPDKTEEELQKMGGNELMLTQACLKKNPKSYVAWHHRYWSMEFFPSQDWNQELKLCNLFLSMDERNFHCWDYRRLAVKKCNVNPKQELAFTSELIEKNFSNYSAWHYRSTLLPVVHPGSTYIAVDEETLLKEYETVQNAAFTDPNDQSVWFYHRWLLGRGDDRLQILSLSASRKMKQVFALMSCPVKVGEDCSFALKFDGDNADVKWHAVGGISGVSSLWLCDIPAAILTSEGNFEVSLEVCRGDEAMSFLTCKLGDGSSTTHRATESDSIFCDEISAATKDVLEKELESCKQLYELEPDNKWTVFTSMLLMRAVDSKKYYNEIYEYLDALRKIDGMRENYYKDLKSRVVIENLIENQTDGIQKVCLSDKGLTSLHHFDYFHLMTEVDLSFNELTSIQPVCYLVSVEVLILDGNRLKDCNDIQNLSCLCHLSVKSNHIESERDLESLTTCPALKKLFLSGNPIALNSGYSLKIKKLLKETAVDEEAL